MQMDNGRKREERKKVSISTTVIFVGLSCLLCYGALRWMGGAVLRFLTEPEPMVVPDEASAILHAESETKIADHAEPSISERDPDVLPVPTAGEQTHVHGKPEPVITETEQDSEGERDDAKTVSEEPLQETGAWNVERRYHMAFHEEQMDVVVVLTDDAGHAEAICILALRGDAAALLAIPSNCIAGNGKLLQTYPAAEAVKQLEEVVPITVQRYLVMHARSLWDALDRIGPFEIGGRSMDGRTIAARFADAARAPLVKAEFFAQILCALPEKMRTLSMLKLLLIKEALTDTVQTNITETEGWALYRVLKELPENAVETYTLPVESVSLSSGRAYRPNVESTERILKNIFEKTEKSSEKTS